MRLTNAVIDAAIKAELVAVNFAAAPNPGRGILFVAKITVPSVLGLLSKAVLDAAIKAELVAVNFAAIVAI